MNNVPAKHQFLGPINEEWISNKHAKNNIVNNLAGKQPPKVFQQYVNAELKFKKHTETNRYAAQKNTTTSFNVENLETFNSILLLTSLLVNLSHKEEYFRKRRWYRTIHCLRNNVYEEV